jgi:hypothetical protein
MNRTAWRRLRAGDMIENHQTGQRYVLIRKHGRAGWFAVREVLAANPEQWRKVTEEERGKTGEP